MSSLLNEPITILVSENGTTGPRGETGNGIESLSILSEAGLVKTYRILFTDGDYFDFEVTDGNGIAAIAKTGTAGLVDTYTITFTNGTTTTFTVTNGEKGDKGDKGDTGNGINSIAKTGTVGLVDTYQIAFTDGTVTTFNVTNGNGILSVEKTGTAGLADTYTITFTNGTTSAYVVTNGKGITVIEKTATAGLTDIYTITYNDGTTSTFTVSNGNGIASVAKTGTAGLVDTYTITFTDGTATTFEVTNGSDTWGQITGTLSDQTDLQNALDDKAPAITETASGAMVTIEDGAEAPVKSLTVGIEPVQDLHGYDAPWPAGGGKNKFNPDTAIDNKYLNENGELSNHDGAVASDYMEFQFVEGMKIYGYTVGSATNKRYCLYNSEKTLIRTGASSGEGMTCEITAQDITDGVTYYRAGVYSSGFKNVFMITVNEVPTSYAPYSNICPITGWTGAEIQRTGKNLLPNDYSYPFTNKGVTVSKNADGSITLSGAKNESSTILVNLHIFQKNIQIFSGKYLKEQINSAVGIVATYYDENDKWVSAQTGMNIKLNVPSRATKMNIQLRIATNDDVTGTVLHPMICENQNDTYEPYQGQTISAAFPSEAGTVYGGTVDVTNRVLTVDRVGHIFDGTENISAVVNRFYYVFPNVIFLNNNSKILTISSHYNGDTANNQYSNRNTEGYLGIASQYGGGNSQLMLVDNVNFPDRNVTAFKEWLATQYSNGTPLTTVSFLATPLTYQLTPQQLTTLLGTNHIWADTGDVTLEYRADTKTYIDNAIAKSQTATRSLITGIEASMTATQNYTAGALIIVGDDLYKATANIASGGTLTVGTNVSKITLAQYILEQLSA